MTAFFSATRDEAAHEDKMENMIPSEPARAEFIDWLTFILRNPEGNIAAWGDYLIGAHDWSASRVVEISGRQTKSGNPEIYIFE